MPFRVVRNDITKMKVDAIVNPTNRYLKGTAGVDGAVHRAAGKELDDECSTLNGCEVGEAKITNAYKLPCKYIIHTVGPIWNGGTENEEQLLFNCYKNSMELAKGYRLSSIAFPLISSGHFAFPKKIALNVACEALSSLTTDSMTIYLVIYDKESLELGTEMLDSIEHLIDDKYVQSTLGTKNDKMRVSLADSKNFENEIVLYEERMLEYEFALENLCEKISADTMRMIMISRIYRDFNSIIDLNKFINKVKQANDTFQRNMQEKIDRMNETVHEIEEIDKKQKILYIQNTDMSFSEFLLHLIDEKRMEDSDVYKAANISKQTFSKIRYNKDYHPKKEVAVAFALALKLNLEETQKLLGTAGYILSDSIQYDVIIKSCILKGEYNNIKVSLILMKYLGRDIYGKKLESP
ncbi:MAG: macro domain-containing protein [Ruminococcus sp.]|nr:macro domain-containing protein [Ruminococcus sp.]